MDLSKLPKLSDSPAPPTPVAPEVLPAEKIEPFGIEYAVVCIGIGLILMIFLSGPTHIIQMLTNPSALPSITDVDGSPLTYSKSAFFWGDLGVMLLSIMLVIDGIVGGFTRSKFLRIVSLLIAVICVLVNLYVIIVLKSKIGLDLFNAVSALFGVLFIVSLGKQLAGKKVI